MHIWSRDPPNLPPNLEADRVAYTTRDGKEVDDFGEPLDRVLGLPNHTYLTQSVLKANLHKSTPPQIRQLSI